MCRRGNCVHSVTSTSGVGEEDGCWEGEDSWILAEMDARYIARGAFIFRVSIDFALLLMIPGIEDRGESQSMHLPRERSIIPVARSVHLCVIAQWCRPFMRGRVGEKGRGLVDRFGEIGSWELERNWAVWFLIKWE